MPEGNYKIDFKAGPGKGTGVISLRSGEVFGGDAVVYFLGKYEEGADGKFTAEIAITQHSPGQTLLGQPKASAKLMGKFDATGSSASLSGQAANGAGFTAVLTRL